MRNVLLTLSLWGTISFALAAPPSTTDNTVSGSATVPFAAVTPPPGAPGSSSGGPTGSMSAGARPGGGRPMRMTLISPVVGYDKNTVFVPGGGGAPDMWATDTKPMTGLFVGETTERFNLNELVFRTNPNSSDVTGNILVANLYGSADKKTTWNVGISYIWHHIDTPGGVITVNEPFVKVGVVQRSQRGRLSINPYLGIGREKVDAGPGSYNDPCLFAGVAANYMRKETQYALKSYLEYDETTHDSFPVARVQATHMLTQDYGWTARAEYMGNSMGADRTLLVGPVFKF